MKGMIFIFIAYEQVKMHTIGFLGLQIALILIAIKETVFVIHTGVAYKFLGGTVARTRTWAILYIVGLLMISISKVVATIYVVHEGVGAAWTMRPSGVFGWYAGQLLDRIWMLFNAILPLFFSRLSSTVVVT